MKHAHAPCGGTATPAGPDCYGYLASEPEPKGGGAMQETLVANVAFTLDHEAGAGWLYVHPDADPSAILKALEALDLAGWEELDPMETGDEPECDEHGRQMILLVRQWR